MNEKPNVAKATYKKLFIIFGLLFAGASIGLFLTISNNRSLDNLAKEYRLEVEQSRGTISRVEGLLAIEQGNNKELREANRELARENQFAQEIADQLAANLTETKRQLGVVSAAFEGIILRSENAEGFIGSAREELRGLIKSLQD